MAGIINKGFTKVSDLTLGNELSVNIPLGSAKPLKAASSNQESPPEDLIGCRLPPPHFDPDFDKTKGSEDEK